MNIAINMKFKIIEFGIEIIYSIYIEKNTEIEKADWWHFGVPCIFVFDK